MLRGLLLVLLVAVLLCAAWFNPPPMPQPPTAPRWVKIDARGKTLPAWGGPWKCVLDTRTGLLWELKSYAEDLHDKQCAFSWYDGQTGIPKAGDCFVEGESSDTADLIEHGNSTRLCGAENWRLPTVTELQQLVIDDPRTGQLKIALDYFPHTQRGPYWSATAAVPLTQQHFARHKEGASTVDFVSGDIQHLPYGNVAFARLVTRYRGQ